MLISLSRNYAHLHNGALCWVKFHQVHQLTKQTVIVTGVSNSSTRPAEESTRANTTKQQAKLLNRFNLAGLRVSNWDRANCPQYAKQTPKQNWTSSEVLRPIHDQSTLLWGFQGGFFISEFLFWSSSLKFISEVLLWSSEDPFERFFDLPRLCIARPRADKSRREETRTLTGGQRVCLMANQLNGIEHKATQVYETVCQFSTKSAPLISELTLSVEVAGQSALTFEASLPSYQTARQVPAERRIYFSVWQLTESLQVCKLFASLMLFFWMFAGDQSNLGFWT